MRPTQSRTPQRRARPSKGRGKLLIIAGIAVAVLGIGGGAAFYFLRATPAEAPAEEAAATPAHKTAIYLNLRPDFIVNSTAVGQRRYLQTNVVVMARDQLVIDAVNTHAPVIRSAIVNLLADEDFMVLQTDEGKKALREKMRAADRLDAAEGSQPQRRRSRSVQQLRDAVRPPWRIANC